MRTVQYVEFGGPEVLHTGEATRPTPGRGQVLVRVLVSGVNPVDAKVRQGILSHIPVTFPVVPGWDLAGIVEEVGVDVTDLAPGDAVLGTTMDTSIDRGTAAEFAVASRHELARIPEGLGWNEAAALPLAGLTAVQALRAAGIASDDTVLIHAAAGGVGHLAVQLAIASGARVIATASERNHDLLRSLGAEPVTYGEGLVARVRALAPDGVDVVLDLGGGPDAESTDGVGAPGARLVSITQPAVVDRGGVFVSVHADADDLAALTSAVAAGALRVVVTAAFPLEEAALAHALVESGTARQKVVLRVAGA